MMGKLMMRMTMVSKEAFFKSHFEFDLRTNISVNN